MKTHRRVMWAVALAAIARTSSAAPPPQTSLNNCQDAVRAATKTFVTNKLAALGTCLQAVSTQIVKKNAVNANAAAAPCVTQFRKLKDSRGLNKQLSDQLAVAIAKKCTPGNPNVTHTLADILGSGAGVPQPLNASDLNAWCARFGGDGSIGSVQEWIDCLSAAAECDVDSAIATQYPRALDWLASVRPAMQALTPPAGDPTKITDAVSALDAVAAAIDGDNDQVPSPQCGAFICGDGVKNGSEACDGSDLGGATCASEGFSSGTLSCTPGCRFNTSGCSGATAQVARPLQTGQTQCDQGDGTLGVCPGSPAGQDGSLQNGVSRSYTDNGDGTITDDKTGLMWEKLSDDGTIHDKDDTYDWYAAFTTKIAALNAGGGFAGYTDWRLPNRVELLTLVDAGRADPSIDPAFNTGCVPNCAVTTCSCTQVDFYWSSTSYQYDPTLAWFVYFFDGYADSLSKGVAFPHSVRAVRGGS